MAFTKRIGIWIRVSTEEQAEGESPEHHEKRGRYYAEAKGWEVVEVYHLEAVSGKSVMGQPETQRMLGDIRDKKITGLIFSKLARLARNTRELLDFADIFREHEADLVSLQESIDTSTPAGRLFYTMVAAMAQWEREEIAERVAASVPIRAKLGKPLGGQAPFGYRWEGKKLVPDAKEAPVRRLLYDLFSQHRRKKTVARLLNEAGHRTRDGSNFSDTTVARLLRDPTAKGERRANYTRSLGDGKKWVLKPESDWVITPVEPIVPEDLWQHCNLILDEQQKKNGRPARKAVHLFTGLAFCGCGHKMYVPSNSPKYICYKCRNKISVGDLEVIFQEQLKAFFFSPSEIAGYLDQADQQIKAKQELLSTLTAQHKQVQRQMDQLLDLYTAGELPKEGFGRRYRPLEEQAKQIADQIPELQGQVDFLKIQFVSRDEILTEARDLYSRWPELDPEEKRWIAESITERIVVGDAEVAVELCYAPGSPELMAEGQRDVIPALPFCHATLRAPKPLAAGYPPHPKTLSEHLRKWRLDHNLTQAELATRLGADETSVWNWENGYSRPTIRLTSKIIELIGFDPEASQPGSLGRELATYRRRQGLSQEELAHRLQIDPATLGRWERGKTCPGRRHLARLERLLGT